MWSWPNLRYTKLEFLWTNKGKRRKICQDSRSVGRELNMGLTEYGIPPPRPWSSIDRKIRATITLIYLWKAGSMWQAKGIVSENSRKIHSYKNINPIWIWRESFDSTMEIGRVVREHYRSLNGGWWSHLSGFLMIHYESNTTARLQGKIPS
jgi:hypothetical protein